MTVWLYGLFKRRKCLYVGISRHPNIRFAQHKYTTLKGINGVRLRVFRNFDDESHAIRVELQVIQAYRRRREAKLNLRPLIAPAQSPLPIHTNLPIFLNRNQLAMHLQISYGALTKRIKTGEYKPTAYDDAERPLFTKPSGKGARK